MLKPAKFLASAVIHGQPVSFFTPPHDELDLPWVDVEELAAAFLAPEDAARMVQHSHNFDRENRPVATARNGDRIATIICHSMAHGMVGAIDLWNGFKPADEDDSGPAHWAYSLAAGKVAIDHWPLEFDQMFAALANVGGPYMRAVGLIMTTVSTASLSHIILTEIEGEPRARDVDIAERLGFERPRDIRKLIERNLAEIEAFGGCATVARLVSGNLVDEYWLTEEQALLVATRSDAENAAQVRHMLIKVFVAWRRGHLGQANRQPTVAEMFLQSAELLVTIEREQSRQGEALAALTNDVARIETAQTVLSSCPSNAESITHLRKRIGKRFGLSPSIIDEVMRQSPYAPKPAGMVLNNHADAQGTTYAVYWQKDVTALFREFVAECAPVTPKLFTHKFIPGRFQIRPIET